MSAPVDVRAAIRHAVSALHGAADDGADTRRYADALHEAGVAVAELIAAADENRKKYGRLHDFVSDAIEGGRLTPADIPDDYDAFVLALQEAAVADAAMDAALARVGGAP